MKGACVFFLLLDLGEDVVLTDQEVLVALDLELSGREDAVRDEDVIALLEGDGDALVALSETARTDGDDLSAGELVAGRLGQGDAGGGLCGGDEALDEDAIKERSDFGKEGHDGCCGGRRRATRRTS